MGNTQPEPETEGESPELPEVPGFTLEDGTFIHERQFYIESPNLVVFLHGDGQHLQNYPHVANYLNDAGFSCYMYDGRCQGRSGGGNRMEPADFRNGFVQFADDLEYILRNRIDYPELRNIFLMGHSLGTTVISLLEISSGLSSIDNRIRGAVLTGTCMESFFPTLRVVPQFPIDNITRNPEWRELLKADPLLKVEAYSSWYGTTVLDAIQECIANMENFRVPVLLLHGTEDLVTPTSAVDRIFDHCSSEDKRKKIYDGFYHEVFLEVEWESVSKDAVDWMKERIVVVEEESVRVDEE